MKQNSSLKTKLWIYLTIFSLLIIFFLWIFQILFLNTYYEISKTKELNIAIKEIKNYYDKENFLLNVDTISKDNGICIQVYSGNNIEYNSISFNKGCIIDKELEGYKSDFINTGENYGSINLINRRYNNKVLIKAIKLDENIYAFVSASLVPLDSTIQILKNQLLIVSTVVLILAFAIGYFISKKISVPIEKLNSSVKELSKRNYKVKFNYTGSITEINELTKNLNNATEELNKTEVLRNELLSNVSHDLKTPLTMIKAYAEMVRDLTYKNKQKREDNLNTIINETDRLNDLVNDIIELSKIQKNIDKLNKENFDVLTLIKNIIKKFNILGFNYIINSNAKKVIICADKKSIERVLYNLISNATNYTGNDKKVIINVEKDLDVKISVTDTGKGIDAKELELIWDRYYKSDKSYKRSSTGSGLGLSIVKSILINHNFEYGVSSSKNNGTTFWFIAK